MFLSFWVYSCDVITEQTPLKCSSSVLTVWFGPVFQSYVDLSHIWMWSPELDAISKWTVSYSSSVQSGSWNRSWQWPDPGWKAVQHLWLKPHCVTTPHLATRGQHVTRTLKLLVSDTIKSTSSGTQWSYKVSCLVHVVVNVVVNVIANIWVYIVGNVVNIVNNRWR